MNAYPRSFRFRHAQASPPKLSIRPAQQEEKRWAFRMSDVMVFGDQPVEWKNFLRFTGRPPSIKFFDLLPDLKRRPSIPWSDGWTLHFELRQDVVILRATRPSATPRPLISAKLAATFPWKLRKYLAKHPQKP